MSSGQTLGLGAIEAAVLSKLQRSVQSFEIFAYTKCLWCHTYQDAVWLGCLPGWHGAIEDLCWTSRLGSFWFSIASLPWKHLVKLVAENFSKMEMHSEHDWAMHSQELKSDQKFVAEMRISFSVPQSSNMPTIWMGIYLNVKGINL